MDTTNVSGLILIFPLNLTSCSFRSFLKKISGISEVLPSQQQQQQQQQVPPKNKEDLIHEIKRLRERIRGLGQCRPSSQNVESSKGCRSGSIIIFIQFQKIGFNFKPLNCLD
jgi:hypothetical protein